VYEKDLLHDTHAKPSCQGYDYVDCNSAFAALCGSCDGCEWCCISLDPGMASHTHTERLGSDGNTGFEKHMKEATRAVDGKILCI
jgi:hypothetical protein